MQALHFSSQSSVVLFSHVTSYFSFIPCGLQLEIRTLLYFQINSPLRRFPKVHL